MKKQNFEKLELKKTVIYQLIGGVTDPNDDPIYDQKVGVDYVTCRSPCQGGTGSCRVP
ncbi:hypothetical protein [Kordia sp.]|uniref:hypothetical protein n=1 Tax=Kordia sp. TaxID=1965332 RepID=UPI003D2B528E